MTDICKKIELVICENDEITVTRKSESRDDLSETFEKPTDAVWFAFGLLMISDRDLTKAEEEYASEVEEESWGSQECVCGHLFSNHDPRECEKCACTYPRSTYSGGT